MNKAAAAVLWSDIIIERAQLYGSRQAFRYLGNDRTLTDGVEQLSYSELLVRSSAIAAQLVEHGVAKKPVVLVYPPGLEFIEALFGTLLAGAIPVPAKPPSVGSKYFSAQINKLIEAVSSNHICSDPSIYMKFYAGTPSNIKWIDTTKVPDSHANEWRHPGGADTDLALIQFTSGSTTDPKGVGISNANLSANCEAIGNAGFWYANESHVSWLPHYHDMGLIGSIFAMLFSGTSSILMSPQSFVRNPMRWLTAISDYHASSSGAPNFGYALALEKCKPCDLAKLDLSNWKAAYCGAEQIQASILESFAEKMAVAGFNKAAFLPCYGMAETSLFVTGRHGIKQSMANQESQRAVSVGRSFDNTQIKIVNPETNIESPESDIGEVWVKGPGVAKGYFGANDENKNFNCSLSLASGEDTGFYCTGDLGFMETGELYICGRIKELIVIRGRNIYPQDLERIAKQHLRSSTNISIAAFALPSSKTYEGETFAVVIGVPKKIVAGYEEIALSIRQSIVNNLDVSPTAIVFVPRREIPKTSSGKTQHNRARQIWLDDQFTVLFNDHPPPVEPSVYRNLDKRLAKLEQRNTKYQFDIEADIDWSRINEPGRYYNDAILAAENINTKVMNQHPEPRSFYEWSAALIDCRAFAALEKFVALWIESINTGQSKSRSLDLLDEEELKHVELFERYAESLVGMYPERVDEVMRSQHLSDAYYLEHFLDPVNYASERQRHYCIWLCILFVEEYTIWLHKMLSLGDSNMQSTWLQAHHCHYREEAMHVVTDYAYLLALETTEEERRAWSKPVLLSIIGALQAQRRDLIELTENNFPDISGQMGTHKSGVKEMLSHSAFKKTRAVAHHFAQELTSPKYEVTGTGYDAHTIHNWIKACVQEAADCSPDFIKDDVRFSEYGFDSISYVRLTVELEQKMNVVIEVEEVHEFGTIASLTRHLCNKFSIPHEFSKTTLRSLDSLAPRKNKLPDTARYAVVNVDGNQTPFFWITGTLFLDIFEEHVPANQPIYFLHHQSLDGLGEQHITLDSAVDYYYRTIKNICPKGPVKIGGFSIGSIFALKVAQRFEAEEDKVEKLILISPPVILTSVKVRKYKHLRRLIKAYLQWPKTSNLTKKFKHFVKCSKELLIRIREAIQERVSLAVQKTEIKFHLFLNRPFPENSHWTYIGPIYSQMVQDFSVGDYQGEVFYITESGNADIDLWLSALHLKAPSVVPIDCGHNDFQKPDIVAQWIEAFRKEFSTEATLLIDSQKPSPDSGGKELKQGFSSESLNNELAFHSGLPLP